MQRTPSTKTICVQVIGGPIAAALLLMEGIGGLHGWQWLFLLEGVLTLIYAIILWVWLSLRDAR